MSRQGLLLLSGNPGAPGDFTSLLAGLDPAGKLAIGYYRGACGGVDLTAMLAGMDAALLEAEQAAGGPLGDQLDGVAYSFGAYLALRWAKDRGRTWRTLILINPTLMSERPVSPVQRAVLATPLLGSLLLHKLAPKLARAFIAQCFAPQTANAAEAAGLLDSLGSGRVWRHALQHKLIQTAHPLTGSYQDQVSRLVIVRGLADQAVAWAPQAELLARLNIKAQVVHEVAAAGHSLLWSHQTQVVPLVAAALGLSLGAGPEADSRIGYQPGTTPRNNVLSYLYDHARNHPHRPAIRWVDTAALAAWSKDHREPMQHRQVSFLEFMHQVDAAAAGLAGLGIAKGDRVIIFLPMSVPMYVAMFAVQKLGAIAVFLDSWARSSHLGASAACATPKAMISHQAAFDLIAGVDEFRSMPLRIVCGPNRGGAFTSSLEQLLKTTTQVPLAAVTSEATALITFTTGSSGTPKGANRTHRFLCAQHEALSKVIPYTPSDTDMPAFPIFSLNNLASGVTTLLPALNLAAPSEYDGAALVGQIVHEGITCTTLSPSMLNAVSRYCQAQHLQLPSLRRVVTGGAPISSDDVAAFKAVAPQAAIWVLYGSTEVEPMAHIEAEEMLAAAVDPDPEVVDEGVNVGHISDDLRYKFIRIVDNAITLSAAGWRPLEVEAGGVGEFIVTGDHVCRDYYNNDEAFRKTKIVDLDGSVWHRTGDLGRLGPAGHLWIVGRIHNCVQRGERYYFPVRAEVILKRLAFAAHGAFLGMPDPKLGERNAVVLQLRPGSVLDAAAVAETLRVFAKNSIPIDSLYSVAQIPMDPRHHSKVEYAVLREQLTTAGAKDYLA